MKNVNLKKLIPSLILIVASVQFVKAQDDDMLSMLDTAKSNVHEKVLTTFKESRIINLQTVETVKAGTMSFNIAHLFGNIGVNSNGGAHTLYGLDNVSDIRFGFDFGLTKNLTIGIGRSKMNELIDGLVKYRICTQTVDNHMPVSIAFYGDASYNPQQATTFYNGVDPNYKQKEIQRLSYVSELIIARKFGNRLSIEIAPVYQHRNYVLTKINDTNGKKEDNDLFSVAGGFRLKLTNRVLIVGDYFYTLSDYRTNNKANPFYNPLALGVEIETGGHVFHLSFTNCSGIIENNFIPRTTDSWLKGGFKFGFNISRVFNVVHHNIN